VRYALHGDDPLMNLEKEALALPSEARARLADRLVESLENAEGQLASTNCGPLRLSAAKQMRFDKAKFRRFQVQRGFARVRRSLGR